MGRNINHASLLRNQTVFNSREDALSALTQTYANSANDGEILLARYNGVSGDVVTMVGIKYSGTSSTSMTVIDTEAASRVETDPTLDSGSTNPVANSAITIALDNKLDKQNLLNGLYPKGSIITTKEYNNPSSWLGGTWELIGGSDANKVYWPAMAIATDSAGTEVNESLPNVKGKIKLAWNDASGGGIIINTTEGLAGFERDGTAYFNSAAIGDNTHMNVATFNFASGQVESDGTTYLPSSASTYQDGAQVKVESIKLFYWERTDDALVIDAFSAVTVADTVESGNSLPVSSGKPVYSALSGVTIECDPTLDSGSTNPVANSAVTVALDEKMDKQNYINHFYPKDSVYVTYEYKNPSTFIGGTWELIGGQDANKNYYPAFAIDTDSAGTTISESLPNSKGNLNLGYAGIEMNVPQGGMTASDTYGQALGGARPTSAYLNPGYDLSRGQVDELGNFIPSSASTYQDGAHVNVNAIKLFFWRRLDNAQIIDVIEPLAIADTVESGNTNPVSPEAVFDALSGVTIQCDPTLDSGSTNPVQNSAITVALEDKIDKQNYLNNIYPKGSVLVTTEYNNPRNFIGGYWQLIGGQDSNKVYWPAFAIDTDNGKEVINESLPNVKGKTVLSWNTSDGGGTLIRSAQGLATATREGTAYWSNSSHGDSSHNNALTFDFAKGQVDGSGNYIQSSASTYQDGAQVKVESIKALLLERTDNRPIIHPLLPLTTTSAVTSGDTDILESRAVYNALDGLKLKRISQVDYDALELAGLLDPNTAYFIMRGN